MAIRNWICEFSKLKIFDKACGRIMKVAFTTEVLHRALLRFLQRSILYSKSSSSSSAKDLLYLRLLVFSRSSGVTNLKVWIVTWYFLMAYIISLFEHRCDLEGELFKDKKWFSFFVLRWVLWRVWFSWRFFGITFENEA